MGSLVPDEEIMAAMARGDRNALVELHDRWAPSLQQVALEMLEAPAEADDCVHDTLLEVWHRARYYSAMDGPVGSWLHLRLRTRALKLLRRRSEVQP